MWSKGDNVPCPFVTWYYRFDRFIGACPQGDRNVGMTDPSVDYPYEGFTGGKGGWVGSR